MNFWYTNLFLNPISAEFEEKLPALAKAEGSEFLRVTPKELTLTQRRAMDSWYVSQEGQQALVHVFDVIWRQMDSVAQWAMPAHDARHALFKTPATSLEYIQSEKVEGYARVGLLGALLHDHGRWAEERIFGGPGAGMIHARLSFLLARELLAETALPKELQGQVLHAVLQHTSGADEADSLPTKITVSADRDQLYGPEIVIRLTHHLVQDGSLSSIYGQKPGAAVMDRLEHFLRCRLPGPLFSQPAQVERLYEILRDFVLMAESLEDSAARFAPELGKDSNKRLIERFNWESHWHRADAVLMKGFQPEASMRLLLSAPNLAPGEAFIQTAVGKAEGLTDEKGERLAGALMFAHHQRVEQDLRQKRALQAMQGVGSDLLTNAVIEKLLAGWGV